MKAYADSYEWMRQARRGFDPLIVTCALNGGVQGKDVHRAVPETPEEIATAAHEAYEAGASVLHIHARDPIDPTEVIADPDVYRTINALVRERCPDIIVNNSTGGGLHTTMEERCRCIEAAPDLASLNLGPDMAKFAVRERRDGELEEVRYDVCTPFTYGVIERLAELMLVHGVKPELEVFHPGQYWVSHYLIERGLSKPPHIHQFVMGYQTSIYPTPGNVLAMIGELPEDSVFFVCGIGPYQLPLTTLAILIGGHVRVGLEDNLYYARGRKFTGNGESVARTVRIARELNREVATPAQARELLGLPPAP